MNIEIIGILVLCVLIAASGIRGPITKEKILFVVAMLLVAYVGLKYATPAPEALTAEVEAQRAEAEQQQIRRAGSLYEDRIEAADRQQNISEANRLQALQEQASEVAESFIASVRAASEDGGGTSGPTQPIELGPTPIEQAAAIDYPIAPGTRPLFVRRVETRPLGRVELGEPPSPDIALLYGYSPLGPSLDRVRTRLLLGALDPTSARDTGNNGRGTE